MTDPCPECHPDDPSARVRGRCDRHAPPTPEDRIRRAASFARRHQDKVPVEYTACLLALLNAPAHPDDRPRLTAPARVQSP